MAAKGAAGQLLSCLFSRPKKVFLISSGLISLTCFYLFLVQNSYTSSGTIVQLLRLEPVGPKTFYYDEVSQQLEPLAQGQGQGQGQLYNHSRKLILFWTPKYGAYSLSGWGVQKDTLRDCPARCDFTVDHDLLSQSDAVVFHPAVDMSLRNELPTPRLPHQIYVMAWAESPHYTLLNLKSYEHFFNWTMTYRRSSEIYSPYGAFIPRATKLDAVPELYLRNKTKLVAWLVSSCSSVSHREDVAEELAKYVPVDIYGRCGPLKCPESTPPHNLNCMSAIAADYKFYLAFENSLCTDYVTEKFFNSVRHGLIPIFYGGHGLDQIAPPHSFINTLNFASIQSLGEYLNYLDGNQSEYLKYFEWTKSFSVGESPDYCHLCTKLSNSDSGGSSSYGHLNTWWNERDEKGNQICLENPSYVDKWKAWIDYVF